MTTAQAPTTSNPLTWPASWPRTSPGDRPWGRFSRTLSVAVALDLLEEELERLGARDVIVSTDLPMRLDGRPRASAAAPKDPGVAVYFELAGAPTVLACDAWRTVAHNLRALSKHIDALRGIDRWGVGDLKKAFAGYKALPAAGSSSSAPWWRVLWPAADSNPIVSIAAIRYRAAERIRDHHPDTGDGDQVALHAVIAARREGIRATVE